MTSKASRCLAVFTKPAVPGRVKTRLQGILGPERCAALHAAFLGDLLERFLAERSRAIVPFDLVTVWDLAEGEQPPVHLLPAPLPALRQRGQDLGERLRRAFDELLAGYRSVCIVGSDHPLLEPDQVAAAFAALERGADLVLGPALDGGYYLIGWSPRQESGGAPAALFDEMPWSTPRLLDQTLMRARALGLAVELLAPAADVDLPADLERLARALVLLPPAVCPRTRAALRDAAGGPRSASGGPRDASGGPREAAEAPR